jgi:hypothetical protein
VRRVAHTHAWPRENRFQYLPRVKIMAVHLCHFSTFSMSV